MVAYIFSFIDRQILSLLIAPIQADLNIRDTEFALLHGLAFSIFYATAGLPIAGLADRMSRPFIISVGIAVWSAATMLCGLAGSFLHLFAARVGVGAGEAALSPATYSLISDLFPRERLGRAIAVYSLGSFAGAGIAFIVGSSVIAAVGASDAWAIGGLMLKPWQLTFLLVGLPGLFLALIVAATVRDPRRAALGASSLADAPPFSAVLRTLWQHRAIFGPHMLGYSLAAMSLFTLLGWSPAFLMRGFAMAPQQAGYVLGAIAVVAGGGGVLASGTLMDWLAARGRSDAPFLTGVIGAIGVVPAIILMASTDSAASAAVFLGVALFFASFPMPPSSALMQIVPPRPMRSRVSAIFLFCNSLGGLTIGSVLVGALNDHIFGPRNMGLSLAIVIGGAAALAAIILSRGMRPFRQFMAATA
ncbi:MFS transporter [Sphingomonas oleivorans]|uniref:MFS transporter n=2 Tax=Sphingomonas oleivorans TaxID=1735121 RepID=A0A2T5G361_9SPHN|nr:MFS transporter [Sphingomonas oleivorans]